jgi:hypothetical protein
MMQKLKILKLVLYIVLSSHWLCCAWYAVGAMKSTILTSKGSSIAFGWVNEQFGETQPDESLGLKYMISMYHAIVTLVAGELPATTLRKILFGAVSVTLGSFVIGIITANLTNIIANANFEKTLPKKVQARASALCRSCFPSNKLLTVKVLSYFNNYHRNRPALGDKDSHPILSYSYNAAISTGCLLIACMHGF